MLLCKYLTKEADDLLKNCRIRFSNFSGCNDPFDFFIFVSKPSEEEIDKLLNNPKIQDSYFKAYLGAGIYTENQKEECIRAIKANKDHIKEWLPRVLHAQQESARKKLQQIKILSFSDFSKITGEDDVLLWSHYTNKHQGFRIVFDFDENLYENLLEVKYGELLQATASEILLHEPSFEEKMKKALFLKSPVWSYEREIRILVLQPRTDYDHASLNPQEIKFIDLGLDCDSVLKESISSQLQRAEYKHIVLRQVKIKDDKCGFDYEVLQK